jgi:hypothetical protein
MLAICSDLDETPNRNVYLEISRFLNTTEPTSMGPGVGLEVGNTIYFDMPPDQFAYWNTDDAGRDMVRTLIRSGHIDCLHSFGDLATTRDHAARALDELAHHDARLDVWIDHGRALTNFGSDIMAGQGDLPGAEAYHADLTCDFGVRFVWRGRVTSVIGQDAPFRVSGLWTPRHPIASASTVTKAVVKHVLGLRDHHKYAMHGSNHVQRRSTLRDGLPVYEFQRCNPHWGGVSSYETGLGLGHVLTGSMLDRLCRREAVCVLYTHLGKIGRAETPFDETGISALHRLRQMEHEGRIRVLTTRRLLRYVALRDSLKWRASRDEDGTTIDLQLPARDSLLGDVDAASDLGGLTFYVPDESPVRLRVSGVEGPKLQANPPDHTGRRSVMVPLDRLRFPEWPSGS